MNDCPLHPSLWGYYPELPHPYLPVEPRSNSDKQDYLEPTDFVISEFHWLEGGVLGLASTYAYAVRWPVLKRKLDDDHWASKAVVDLASIHMDVEPYESAGQCVIAEGRLAGTKVLVCDHYLIAPRDGNLPTVKVEDLPTYCATSETIILTPKSMDKVAALLLQVVRYEDSQSEQVDLKKLQKDTLIVLRKAREIVSGKRSGDNKRHLKDQLNKFKSSLFSIGGAQH